MRGGCEAKAHACHQLNRADGIGTGDRPNHYSNGSVPTFGHKLINQGLSL